MYQKHNGANYDAWKWPTVLDHIVLGAHAQYELEADLCRVHVWKRYIIE